MMSFIFTMILANYLSGIFAVFQYNRKPWQSNVDITPYQFSRYLKAQINGEIPLELQANAFKVHGLSFLLALLVIILFIFLSFYLLKKYVLSNHLKKISASTLTSEQIKKSETPIAISESISQIISEKEKPKPPPTLSLEEKALILEYHIQKKMEEIETIKASLPQDVKDLFDKK